MILLSIKAEVRGNDESPPPFLGSALHGLFERALHQHSVGLLDSLTHGQDKRYAIYAPPVGAPVRPFRFGTALYGSAASHWADIAAALGRGRFIRAGSWRVDFAAPVVAVMDRVGKLHSLDQPIDPAVLPIEGWIPPWAPRLEPAKSLELRLLTPLRLTTSAKRLSGQGDALPSLTSIVKSIHRRLSLLEPAWMDSIMAADGWRDAEPQAQAALSLHHDEDLPVVRWPHHRLAINLYGRVGTMQWRGHFSPALIRLLELGQWVGAGQGTTLGMGFFQLGASH